MCNKIELSDIEWDIEIFDWRIKSRLAMAFVDQLLLSLIRAHPDQAASEKPEYVRLRDAKSAVFGIKPVDDLKTIRDYPFLEQMALEYIADRGGAKYNIRENTIEWGEPPTNSPRSVNELARDVISKWENEGHKFSQMVERKSVVARLARKFRKEKDDLILEVADRGGLDRVPMRMWSAAAKTLFGQFGIPLSMQGDPINDLKQRF